MRRFPLPLFLLIVLLTRAAIGQSPNGTISGLVSIRPDVQLPAPKF